MENVSSLTGLIKENGEINWNCPCLGGMAAGPCGYEFRQAFSCFHYSTVDQKGSDCVEQFRGMQDCMAKYPGLYDTDKDGGEMPSMDEKDLDDPESKRNTNSAASEVNSKTDAVSKESKT